MEPLTTEIPDNRLFCCRRLNGNFSQKLYLQSYSIVSTETVVPNCLGNRWAWGGEFATHFMNRNTRARKTLFEITLFKKTILAYEPNIFLVG